MTTRPQATEETLTVTTLLHFAHFVSLPSAGGHPTELGEEGRSLSDQRLCMQNVYVCQTRGHITHCHHLFRIRQCNVAVAWIERERKRGGWGINCTSKLPTRIPTDALELHEILSNHNPTIHPLNRLIVYIVTHPDNYMIYCSPPIFPTH